MTDTIPKAHLPQVGEPPSESGGGSASRVSHCSFCGKDQHQVRKMMAGPTAFICDECVMDCIDCLLAEYRELQLPANGLLHQTFGTGLDGTAYAGISIKQMVELLLDTMAKRMAASKEAKELEVT